MRKEENEFELMGLEIEEITLEELIEEEKQAFVDNYLESHVWRAKNSSDAKRNFNKWVDVRLKPANKESAKTVYSTWNRMKHHYKNDWDTFLADVMFSVLRATEIFRAKTEDAETFDWFLLNTQGSVENLELHKYVSKAISRDISQYATELAGKQTTELNGKKAFRKMNGLWETSLEQTVTDTEGESLSFHDMLGEESNLFYSDDSRYTPTRFMQFFDDKKGELELDEWGDVQRDENGKAIIKTKGFLTLTQLEFLTIMGRNWHEQGNAMTVGVYSDSNHSEEHKKTKYDENQAAYMRKAIRIRTMEAYKKAYPNGEPRISISEEVTGGIELFTGFVTMIEKSEANKLNENVMDWIGFNWSETKVAHLIQDNFTDAEQYDINGSIMNPVVKVSDEIINKIVELGKVKLHELENWDSIPRTDLNLRNPQEIEKDRLAYAKAQEDKLQSEKPTGKGYFNLTLNAYGDVFIQQDSFF